MVFFCMVHDVAGDDMFHDLAADTCQRYWSVVGSDISLAFLVDRSDIGLSPYFWYNTCVIRLPEDGSKYGGHF